MDVTSRSHPLDAVFKTVAAVEAARLRRGEFSLARAAALGEGAEGSGASLLSRLVEEDGSAAYTYDWLASRRVEDGSGSAALEGGLRAQGKQHLEDRASRGSGLMISNTQ